MTDTTPYDDFEDGTKIPTHLAYPIIGNTFQGYTPEQLDYTIHPNFSTNEELLNFYGEEDYISAFEGLAADGFARYQMDHAQ